MLSQHAVRQIRLLQVHVILNYVMQSVLLIDNFILILRPKVCMLTTATSGVHSWLVPRQLYIHLYRMLLNFAPCTLHCVAS